mmetsp:Transcript_56603/g.184092  ORF Transcript_56603/g.184092 Transcript_56603/m.184092 type:complete len:104 (+) Transcript_56603:1104-1415(+)
MSILPRRWQERQGLLQVALHFCSQWISDLSFPKTALGTLLPMTAGCSELISPFAKSSDDDAPLHIERLHAWIEHLPQYGGEPTCEVFKHMLRVMPFFQLCRRD